MSLDLRRFCGRCGHVIPSTVYVDGVDYCTTCHPHGKPIPPPPDNGGCYMVAWTVGCVLVGAVVGFLLGFCWG